MIFLFQKKKNYQISQNEHRFEDWGQALRQNDKNSREDRSPLHDNFGSSSAWIFSLDDKYLFSFLPLFCWVSPKFQKYKNKKNINNIMFATLIIFWMPFSEKVTWSANVDIFVTLSHMKSLLFFFFLVWYGYGISKTRQRLSHIMAKDKSHKNAYRIRHLPVCTIHITLYNRPK